jgi:hypothetical protein
MSTLQPPTVATWLLEHLQSSANKESLAGDLFEEYRQGRSRVWYWKQVLAAITVGLCRELVAHPVLALRAIAMALAVRFLYLYGVAPFLFRAVKPILPLTWFQPIGPLLIVWRTLDMSLCVATGWTLARFHHANRTGIVLTAAISVFLYQLRGLPWIWFHAKNTLTNSRFLPYLVTDWVALILPPLSILVGGLWRALPERNARAKEKSLEI